MNGWIKLYRQLQEHWIWKTKEPYDKRSAWQYILLQAFFREEKTMWKGSLIDVKRGQFPTSIRTLSEQWMWSNGKVNRFIDKLKAEQMIETERIENGTLLTVVNYGFYQGEWNSDGTPTDTPIDTPTEHQRNSCGTLTEQLRNTNETVTEHNIRNKEDKNIKNEKEGEECKEDKKEVEDNPKKKEPTIYYPNDTLLDSAFKEFLVMRNKIKKPIATKQTLTRMMNRIEKLSGGNNDLAVKMLNQSTDHCWQDVYELKEDKQSFHSTAATAHRSREEKLANLLQKIKESEENDVQ